MIDLITPTHEIAERIGYKGLAELLKISNPAACMKIKGKKYSIEDVQIILSTCKRIMLLDKK